MKNRTSILLRGKVVHARLISYLTSIPFYPRLEEQIRMEYSIPEHRAVHPTLRGI
jgi:hypothetical protein